MNRKTLALLAVVAMLLLAGCTGGASTQEKTPTVEQEGPQQESVINEKGFGEDEVTRFVDREAGVVCYKFAGFEKGGLSCLPINETDLAR